jgi:hypothetical protein
MMIVIWRGRAVKVAENKAKNQKPESSWGTTPDNTRDDKREPKLATS